MKTNRLFRLTDKEIEAVTKACISAKESGDGATLQRAIDKMFRSQWYSDTQLFSPSEKSAQQKMHPTLGESSASDSESKPAPKRVI